MVDVEFVATADEIRELAQFHPVNIVDLLGQTGKRDACDGERRDGNVEAGRSLGEQKGETATAGHQAQTMDIGFVNRGCRLRFRHSHNGYQLSKGPTGRKGIFPPILPPKSCVPSMSRGAVQPFPWRGVCEPRKNDLVAARPDRVAAGREIAMAMRRTRTDHGGLGLWAACLCLAVALPLSAASPDVELGARVFLPEALVRLPLPTEARGKWVILNDRADAVRSGFFREGERTLYLGGLPRGMYFLHWGVEPNDPGEPASRLDR